MIESCDGLTIQFHTYDLNNSLAALENFKNNIVLVQANVRQELIDGAISANKNANNVYMVHAFFDILARVFGNK